MAFDWTGLIFGSFPSSAAVAVLRLILLATGAVAAPGVSGVGAAAAGGGGGGGRRRWRRGRFGGLSQDRRRCQGERCCADEHATGKHGYSSSLDAPGLPSLCKPNGRLNFSAPRPSGHRLIAFLIAQRVRTARG